MFYTKKVSLLLLPWSVFEKVRLKPKVSGTFCGSGSGSWGTWSTLSSSPSRAHADPKSLFTQFQTELCSPLPPQAGSAGGSSSQQKRHWHLIFGASLNVGLPSPAGGCAGAGEERDHEASSWGESTRHPLQGMATASSTGLSTGARLHPSSSPPSPGHPWLLPREGQAELCGGGNVSDPREDRRGGNAGKEAWQPLAGWWWLLLCSVTQPLCESPLPGSLRHKAPTAEAGSSSGLAGLDECRTVEG